MVVTVDAQNERYEELAAHPDWAFSNVPKWQLLAAVTLLVLLFLTKPLSYLPNSVLAAIVFMIGVKLIDHRGLAEICRASPTEFLLALITAATVVFFGVEQGILLATVMSLLMHVRQGYRPHTGVIVRDSNDHWRIDDPLPGKEAEPGLVMFWFGGGLFYANVAFFAEQARKLVHDSPTPVLWLVVDASSGVLVGDGSEITIIAPALSVRTIELDSPVARHYIYALAAHESPKREI